MRYVTKENASKVRNIEGNGSIAASGSVTGMQKRYGWPKGGQVRIGGYIYNVGVNEVERLRNLRLLRGE